MNKEITTTVRTKPPSHYIPPTKKELIRFVESKGLTSNSTSIVADMANIAAGGTFTSIVEVEKLVREKVSIKLKADGDGDFKAPTSDLRTHLVRQKETFLKDANSYYVKNEATAIEATVLREVQDQINTQELLRQIDFSLVPGGSPLDKAVNTIKALGTEGTTKKITSYLDLERPDELSLLRGKAVDACSPQKISKRLNSIGQVLQHLKPDTRKMLCIPDNSEDPEEAWVEAAKFLSKEWNDVLLKAANHFGSIKSIKLGAKQKFVNSAVATSYSRYRPPTDLSEIGKFPHQDLVMGTRLLTHRVITDEVRVKQHLKKENALPVALVICDCSSSMHSNYKMYNAQGMILSMCEQVMQGECILLFAFFEKECYDFHLVHNMEQDEAGEERVVSFYRDVVLKETFPGGGTNVRTAIKQAISTYEEKLPFIEGELLKLRSSIRIALDQKYLIVINDGEDCVKNVTLHDLQGFKLHAFVLLQENNDMKKLCKLSGGSYRQKVIKPE